jgi:transposase
MKALLITAPAELREQLPTRSAVQLAQACARLRPARDLSDPAQGTKRALRHLAARYQALTAEITEADTQLAVLKQARPDLLAVRGVGVETAAQLLTTCDDNPDRLQSEAAFASLCGVSPVPASSGKTRRHRLNRGGDRQANRALYMIVITRLVMTPAPAPTSSAAPPKACPRKRSSAPSALHRPRNLQDPHQHEQPRPRTPGSRLTNIEASITRCRRSCDGGTPQYRRGRLPCRIR